MAVEVVAFAVGFRWVVALVGRPVVVVEEREAVEPPEGLSHWVQKEGVVVCLPLEVASP